MGTEKRYYACRETEYTQRRVKLLKDRIKCLDLMMTDIAIHMSEVHVRGSGEPQKNEWYIARRC